MSISKEIMEQLEALTSAEKEKAYSKYFYNTPASPDEDVLEAIRPGRPMDLSDVTLPENINNLLDPGYLKAENGYCQLPNGGAYVAVMTKMPGITLEMSKWFHSWHELEDLNYKIWLPKSHYMADVELGWILEDIGEGPADIVKIGGGAPEEMGFDAELFRKANVILGASTALYKLCDAPATQPPIPFVICHIIREVPGGLEYRSRYWMGYQSGYKGMKLKLRPGTAISGSSAYHLALHCANELANLRSFLPSLYQEVALAEAAI